MQGIINYRNLMEILSACGIGALVLSADDQILSINEAGDFILQGNKKMSGKYLSDAEIPSCVRELCAEEISISSGTAAFARQSEKSSRSRTNASEENLIYVAFEEYICRHPVPEPDDLPPGARLVGFRSANAEFQAQVMRAVLDKISEGVVTCDSREQLIYYNDAAAKVDSVVLENVRGRKIRDVYTMTDGSDVMLPRVMKQRSPSLNYRQKYTTFAGKHQDVVANAYPIITNGKLLGAFNVVEDWSKLDDLHKQIIDLQEKLVTYGTGSDQKKSALSARYTFNDILHHSEAMKLVIEQCRQVAKTDSSVMIYGETGTGKELFAQSIHNASSRANGPFLAINCAALPENLLESLLFGSVKGAYTGAENRTGLFEQANHGTLLLDEINSMNINLQAKLLRVLQEGKIRKVGGSQEIAVDVRVLSNINVPPYEAIASNHLRQDLFYRLGVVNINIPPLRERLEDIPPMVSFFIEENNRKLNRNVQEMDQETIRIFQQYSWPGNVRELQHAVEHAMIIMPEYEFRITRDYIPQHLLEAGTLHGIAPQRQGAFLQQQDDFSQRRGSLQQQDDFSQRRGPLPQEQYDPETGRWQGGEMHPYRTESGPGAAGEGSEPSANRGERRPLGSRLNSMEEDEIRKAMRETGGNISRAAKLLDLSRQNLQYRLKRYGIDPGEFKKRH